MMTLLLNILLIGLAVFGAISGFQLTTRKTRRYLANRRSKKALASVSREYFFELASYSARVESDAEWQIQQRLRVVSRSHQLKSIIVGADSRTAPTLNYHVVPATVGRIEPVDQLDTTRTSLAVVFTQPLQMDDAVAFDIEGTVRFTERPMPYWGRTVQHQVDDLSLRVVFPIRNQTGVTRQIWDAQGTVIEKESLQVDPLTGEATTRFESAVMGLTYLIVWA